MIWCLGILGNGVDIVSLVWVLGAGDPLVSFGPLIRLFHLPSLSLHHTLLLKPKPLLSVNGPLNLIKEKETNC